MFRACAFVRLLVYLCLSPCLYALKTAVNHFAPDTVPKILHQTAKDQEHVNDFMEQCQTNHEEDGWEYKFWDDDSVHDFVKEHFASRYERWNEMSPPIRKFDTVRYMWMHHFGGVYIDSDVECLRAATSLVEALPKQTAWIPEWPDPFALMSTPGNNFWLEMIDRVLNNWRQKAIMASSGPEGLRLAVKEWVRQRGKGVITPWVLSNNTESELVSGIQNSDGVSHKIGEWTFFEPESSVPEKVDTGKNLQQQLLGFLPNKLVDPTACKEMLPTECKDSFCGPLPAFSKFNGALFAHHCAGSWHKQQKKHVLKQQQDLEDSEGSLAAVEDVGQGMDDGTGDNASDGMGEDDEGISEEDAEARRMGEDEEDVAE
eukprot:TRINITY_DN42404_c0_g1_i1.p1 TRINITY_DN42404_c0_g1~~TRINITY_DN42404_c0_g1_i1.p1  ORF type:complete len:372 (-),score=76.21 TRINITY_DN42404_c0_g1_i1:101-1216(-)